MTESQYFQWTEIMNKRNQARDKKIKLKNSNYHNNNNNNTNYNINNDNNNNQAKSVFDEDNDISLFTEFEKIEQNEPDSLLTED